MGLYDRDYMKENPPPDYTRRSLFKFTKGSSWGKPSKWHFSKKKKSRTSNLKTKEKAKVEKLLSMDKCPNCGELSLFWNERIYLYECLNPNCRRKFTEKQLAKSVLGGTGSKEASSRKSGTEKTHYKIPVTLKMTRKVRHYTRPLFQTMRRLFRNRWFIAILGLAIVFLCIAFYPSFVNAWPWGGESYIKWMEIPIEVFGAMLVLISTFTKRHRTRVKLIKISILLALIIGGATYGYHHLDETGKIDAWLNRSSDEGTIAGSLRNLIQESGGTQFISVEEFDDSDSQHAGSTSCTPELPEGAILTPVGTILLPDLGDTGIAINGTVVNPRAFMKPGVEEALSKACVFPNESGWAKIEATKLNDIEQLKLKEEEAKNAKLAAELAAQEALDAAEKARIAAELERLAEEQAKAELTSRVWSGNSYLVGGDWDPIIIVNNPEAKNPSWNQLTSFLRRDDTDKHEYDYGSFVCADFAEMLHNNAEDAGWRCAYVSIELSGYPDFYNLGISSNTGHALNAFETTDRGLVYIDSTNSLTGAGPTHGEALVEVKVGEPYNQEFIFPSSGWFIPKGEMGTVTKIDTIQW